MERASDVNDAVKLYRWSQSVRTNIEIDDKLIATALQVSRLPTQREAVEEGLRLLIKLKRQDEVRTLFGQVRWDGELARGRLGRERD